MNAMYHKMNSVFNKCFDMQGMLEYESGTVRKLFGSTMLVVRSLPALNKKLEGKV